MNKAELVRQVAQRAGMSQASVNNVLNALTATITRSLAEGEAVRIPGLGTFGTRVVKARVGRNPSTGDAIDVPEKARPTFKAGAEFKDRVSLAADGPA